MTRHPGRSHAALALCATIVIGCATATPSAPPPSASVITTESRQPDLTPAPSPTPVPDAGVEERVFRIAHMNSDGSGHLPVVLRDRTGLVVGIAPQEVPAVEDGVSNPAGQPDVLRYQWTGGACDTSTSITLEPMAGGYRLLSTTLTTGDICIMIGVFRGIDIQLSEPIDAGSVIVGPR